MKTKKPYNASELTVLIVDSHDLMRKAIGKILKKNQFEKIVESSSGADAVDIFTKKPVDLVICDLYMQKTNGFEVLEIIRSHRTNSDVPFIVVSGEASKEEIVRAADHGADDYIVKPFKGDELERKISTILTKYHSPSPLLAQLRRGDRHILHRDYPKARISVEMALQIDPKSNRGNYLKAVILDETGDVLGARNLLLKNIATNPKYLPNYKTLADIYQRLGKTDECIDAMSTELEINPKQPYRQVQLAQLLIRKDQFHQAIEHFRQSLLEDGKLAPSLFGMGKAHAMLDNLEKAMYYFKRLRRHHPSNTKSLEAMVKYSLESDAPKTAEIALRNEKKSHPKRMDTYIVLAKFYAATNADPLALKTIQEALEISPEFIDGLQIKAALEYKLGQLSEAVATYKKIVGLSNDTMAILNLAEILIAIKNYPEAVAYLQVALKTKKQIIRVTYWLAEANAATGQLIKALLLYSKLLQLQYNDPNIPKNIKKIKKLLRKRRESGQSQSLQASG